MSKRKSTANALAAFSSAVTTTPQKPKRVRKTSASKLMKAATVVLGASSPASEGESSRVLFPLLDFPEHPLVRGTVVQRPSARNRSPYVGDVKLADGRVAIAHMPCLDMGGKCGPGAEVLLRPAVDKKTRQAVGSEAVGKFGTPKCEFILVLLRNSEPENLQFGKGGVWVGAHPSHGEKVADALLRRGALADDLGIVTSFRREVTGVAGTDMRCDFLLSHPDGSRTVLEIKTVVDTDYDAAVPRENGEGGVVRFFGPASSSSSSSSSSYERSGIFPWGRSNQVGPDGEKVVSARAIKHVRELTAIASGEKTEAAVSPADGGDPSKSSELRAAVLFIVARRDALKFRPNAEACPSFARYLKAAKKAGVRVIARRVRWEDDDAAEEESAIGSMFAGGPIDDGPIPIEF